MAAQLIASKGVKVVLTGQVGPNAYNALTASKVKIITGVSGTVLDAVEKFKRGELKQTERPTVSGHFGLGGRGMGRGMGRGRRQ
jgi:predicted Fe-Mo cluster-binding NifX family protein